MSTEMHNTAHGAPGAGAEPRNADVSFETTDVQATTIYWYLGALAIAVILSYVVCVFVLRLTTKIAVEFDTPPPTIRQEMGSAYEAMPPEPRLQGVPGHLTDPQTDLRQKIASGHRSEREVRLDRSECRNRTDSSARRDEDHRRERVAGRIQLAEKK